MMAARSRERDRDRDILSVFAQERQALQEPVPAPVAEASSSLSSDRGERPPEAAPRRPTYETEDLDIPAFLRRNR